MAKKNQSYCILPKESTKFGTVYVLKEGGTIHGTFATVEHAERRKRELIRLSEEIKVIKDSEEMEFEVDL